MRGLLILIITTFTLYAQGINWIADIKKAQELAKKENKIIVVYIEAKHCPWCEKMKKSTLSDKDIVRNINKDYIALKIDANLKSTQDSFGSVGITPTTMFYSPNGDPLEMLEGFQEVEFFFWGMSKAEKKFIELKGEK